MDNTQVFCPGKTSTSRHAAEFLSRNGVSVVSDILPEVTHVLLDVPSFQSNGTMRWGEDAEAFLSRIPKNVTVCGGNLRHPALSGYQTVDFLQDEAYLCENAYITAECALDTALPYLNRTLRNCPVLITGWGRIGKCLAKLLRSIGTEVCVAVRDPSQEALLSALGYHGILLPHLEDALPRFRLIFNTIPSPVLSRAQLGLCRDDCVKIELASSDGMDAEDVIIARGLPGLHMPESSGILIGETFLRLCHGR